MGEILIINIYSDIENSMAIEKAKETSKRESQKHGKNLHTLFTKDNLEKAQLLINT